jgi:hypothetical protein
MKICALYSWQFISGQSDSGSGLDSGQWSGRDPGFGGVHREARKALEPTSYTRLQDFLDALQSFEASDSRLQDFVGTLQSLKPTLLRYLAKAISFFPKSLAYT